LGGEQITSDRSMRDSFGARLRRHRELCGVSLADIAEQTKIKASLLDGLERDDVSQWPSGIFRRAYVRAYATAIGFDPDSVVREFLVVHPDPSDTHEPRQAPQTGLRGLFESLRRRAPSPPLTSPVPDAANGTALTRPAELPVPELDRPLTVVPSVSAAAKAAAKAVTSLSSSRKTSDDGPRLVTSGPASSASDELRVSSTFSAPETSPGHGSDAEPGSSAWPPELQRRRDAGLPAASAEVGLPAVVSTEVGLPAVASTEVGLGPRTSNFLAAAKICTELGRVEDVDEVLPLLAEAATLLDARGLIAWVWDGAAEEIKPVFVHGYSGKVRSRLRGVAATADNLIAATFRTRSPLARQGALAVPLLAPSGCAGVLVIEVEGAREQDEDVRALTIFFAAMLAQLIGAPVPADARDIVPAPRVGEAAPSASDRPVRRQHQASHAQ